MAMTSNRQPMPQAFTSSQAGIVPGTARRGAGLDPAAAPAPQATHQTTNPEVDAAPQGLLVVGPGIQVKGGIQSCDTLVVEGTVEASLKVRKLELRSGGRFTGKAEVEEADITGDFDGELAANGELTLGSSGKVNGKVRYRRIIIEGGGQVSGDISILS
ncbi:MAG: polymer-forming cytoskeletal protein [Pseudomonadota bacterium]